MLLARAPTPTAAAQILERLNPRVAADVLSLLDDVLVRAMLAVTNPAKAAPIIGGLDPTVREAQLARLDERVALQIREMLAYPAESAGALMDPRISAFGPDTTVEGALRKMRTFKEKELGSIYLMDAEGRLAGAVPLGEIATAEPETQLRELIRGEPISVFVHASREEVVKALDERRVATLPVVDGDSKLVGVIRYRDARGGGRGRGDREHADHGRRRQRGARAVSRPLSPSASVCPGSRSTSPRRSRRRSSWACSKGPSRASPRSRC